VLTLQNLATVPAHIWLKYLKARLVVTQTPDERKEFEEKCAKALSFYYSKSKTTTTTTTTMMRRRRRKMLRKES